MNRREFLKALMVGSLLLTAGCGERSIKEKFFPLEINHLRQLITKDPSTTRTIMFEVEAPLSNPIIELRRNDEIKIFNALDCSFIDDEHQYNQYCAFIDGLESNSAYEFRAVDGDEKSDWFELKTHDRKNFKALIFPDSQCADYEVWSQVARSAHEKNPDAEFFINVGDLVDNGEDWTQWRAWFDGAPFIAEIPFVPVVGNHETYSRQWTVRDPVAYLNLFNVPSNDSVAFNRYYYSFDYGDAHFTVLNTEPVEGLIEEQQSWLRRDVESTDRKWKIILMHRDVLQYRINGRDDRAEGFSSIGVAFMPLFDQLGIDLVLTGHLHTYRNRGRIFNFDRAPRGTFYILTGIAGDVRYPGLWIDHALDEYVAPQPETDNYLTLDVDADSLTVKCFLPDGREIDRAIIIKN